MKVIRSLKRYINKEAIFTFTIFLALLSMFPFGSSVSGNEDSSAESESLKCDTESPLCSVLTSENSAVRSIAAMQKPQVKLPTWLEDKKRAEERAQRPPVTYTVQAHGTVKTNLDSFAQLAAETFADKRGWSQLGVRFERVQEGGQFTLVLSEASKMTDFSASGCDTTYSCRVGDRVIINEDRWLGATDPWNASGGSLRDYQHMVINHETGHWLGHGHYHCSGEGNPAPVMQQQSMNLQGCTFNPWPVEFELTSSRLGI